MAGRPKIARRTHGDEAEVRAWSMVFGHRFDYLGDLAQFGYPKYSDIPEADIKAAWRRLGALYLTRRPPSDSHDPWALREYGWPPGYRPKR